MSLPNSWDKVPTIQTRKAQTREPRKRFLIVCEGSATEPNYFKRFGAAWIDIKIEGGEGQWTKVVEAAVLANQQGSFEEVWCVFDRDIDRYNHKAKNLFYEALNIAKQKGFKVAYSIDAFEIWLLLHFGFYDKPINRFDYALILTDLLGKKYKKSDPYIYDYIIDHQKTALRNARRLHARYDYTDRYSNNPSTTVYLLVEALLQNQL